MTTRRFSRPRTKVYDCNYSMGECYYKPTLDSLDRKGRGIGPPPIQEQIQVPQPPTRVQRPKSMGNLDALMVEGRIQKGVQEEMDEEIAATLRRIRAERAAAVPTPEEGFEHAFMARRDQVKRRFADKMLDSVGINGALSEDEPLSIKKRSSRLLQSYTDERDAPAVLWTTMEAPEFGSSAAAARSLKSRSRLADLEAEMEEMAERGAARERRAAAMRSFVQEEAANTMSLTAKKVTSTAVTTQEKRTLAY